LKVRADRKNAMISVISFMVFVLFPSEISFTGYLQDEVTP